MNTLISPEDRRTDKHHNNIVISTINLYFCYLILSYIMFFFCPKLNISTTTELIEFSFLGKLHIGPGMVLGYFYFSLGLVLCYFLPLLVGLFKE